MDATAAETDFKRRIQAYEGCYETIDPATDRNITYCKMINVGQQVVTNKIEGYLQSRIVFYLMNL
jgi:6-phosphofructo-2-kinase/fructose-2,6-biphosphatase 2